MQLKNKKHIKTTISQQLNSDIETSIKTLCKIYQENNKQPCSISIRTSEKQNKSWIILTGSKSDISCRISIPRNTHISPLLKWKLRQGIMGVNLGFKMKMSLSGIGYWIKQENNKLIANVGLGQEKIIEIPNNIKIEITTNSQEGYTEVKGFSHNKDILGHFMSKIQNWKAASKDKYNHKGFSKISSYS